jgi:hypothetical protein
MTDEEKIVCLSESNMELSLMLIGNRKDMREVRGNHVSYLFGKPLDEIYAILVEHESRQPRIEPEAGSGVWIRRD